MQTLQSQCLSVPFIYSLFPIELTLSLCRGIGFVWLFGGNLKKKIEELLTKYGVSSTPNRIWIIAQLMQTPDLQTDIEALLSAAAECGQSKSTTYRNLSLLQRHTIISIRRGQNVRLTKLKMEISIL